MANIQIVEAVYGTKGIEIEFDKRVSNYFEIIPGSYQNPVFGNVKKLRFPMQFDLDEVLDQIKNQSIKKVKKLDINDDFIIIKRRRFFHSLHMDHATRPLYIPKAIKSISTKYEYRSPTPRKKTT